MDEEQTTPMINASPETDIRSVAGKVKITEEDKERFFKSILADKCYEETVSLFDNQLNLTFKALTVQENSDVVAQVERDKKNGVANETDAYYITISCYRLGLSLVSIDAQQYSSVTRENFNSSSEKDTYILARSKSLLGWSTSKLSVYLDAFQIFEQKLVKLTSEAQTPNFWKASA
jgi:hypothetical protein